MSVKALNLKIIDCLPQDLIAFCLACAFIKRSFRDKKIRKFYLGYEFTAKFDRNRFDDVLKTFLFWDLRLKTQKKFRPILALSPIYIFINRTVKFYGSAR